MKPTAVASKSAFIENGLIEIFGVEYSDLRSGSKTLLQVKESAVQNFGKAETCGMFLRAGRAAFYYWMRQYSDALGWHEVDFRLLPAPVRIKRSLSDALKWFEDEDYFKGEITSTNENWQIKVKGLTEKESHLDCNLVIGMLQELVCWAGAGKFYPAREIECQASSVNHYLFEIAKQPAG